MEFMTGEWFGRLFGVLVVRLIFAGVITLLLEVPLLQVVGGLLLVWIAWGLVHEDDGGEGDEEKVKAGSSTWQAARIGGEVDFALLIIGLATTIPLVIFGAALLTTLLNRFPFLVYLGAGLLVYLAVEMFFADKVTHPYLKHYHSIEWIIGLVAAGIFMLVAWLWARRSSGEEAG